ncbi:MAG: universal stress protein [Gammaproteobacteria bacterium]
MLPEIKTIVYATDLEDADNVKAYRMAVAIAHQHQARIVMIHAMEPVSANTESLLKQSLTQTEIDEIKAKGMDSLRAELHRQVEDFCASENPAPNGEFAGGEPLIEIASGSPADVILEKASQHKADLIVMGTRTHSTIGQVLGSTANKVIHRGTIPVMVCPL